jgi:hypothetical protein
VLEALCLLCGSLKETVESPCSDCGHQSREEEMELAHLFSLRNLSREDLVAAGERIASGDRPAPRVHHREQRVGPGLAPREMALVSLGNLVFTPLVGFTCWWGWRNNRPRAARQVLGVTSLIAIVLGLCWGVLVY